MHSKNEELTKGTLLTKNVIFNFLGKIFPLIAGIVCIPILIDNIGTERFGVLAILWLLIGYFGILDFGFSKSIVYELGRDLRSGTEDLSKTTGTIITILLAVGIVLGLVVFFSAPYFVEQVFELPADLVEEVKNSFIILSFGIPVTMMASGFRGILETFQAFKKISLTDTITGGATYLGLAAVSFFSSDLAMLTIILVGIKISIVFVFSLFCKQYVENRIFTFAININKLKSAFNFGKWIAISNVINPVMGQIDRYIIGSVITMSAVTYYTAPFDMIQKISLIPVSITAVLFPAFTLTSRSVKKSSSIFSNSILAVIVLVFPIVALLILFAQDILFIWLGQEFVDESTLVLQILIIGAFVNSIAKIPFTFLEGMGLPKITAKLHLSEFAAYVPILWLLINYFGIVGAAFARTIRVFIDWFALSYIASEKISSKAFIWETLLLIGMLIGLYYVSTFSIILYIKIPGALLFLIAYFYVIWAKYLGEENKELFLKKLNKFT